MAAVRIRPVMVYLDERERRELARRAEANARSLSAELRHAARLGTTPGAVEHQGSPAGVNNN